MNLASILYERSSVFVAGGDKDSEDTVRDDDHTTKAKPKTGVRSDARIEIRRRRQAEAVLSPCETAVSDETQPQ